jgi:hypothetical protein
MTYDQMMAELEMAGTGSVLDQKTVANATARPTLKSRPLTTADIAGFMAAIADGTKKYVEAQTKPLREKIAALEARTANLKYCGTWKPGTFLLGNLVTHHGSIFHCDADTTSEPGTPGAPWRLAVKRGRDGK